MEQNEIVDQINAVIEKYIPGFEVISYLGVKEPTERILENNLLLSTQVWVCLTKEMMFTAKPVAYINPTNFLDTKDYTLLKNFKTSLYVDGVSYDKTKAEICFHVLADATGCGVPWLAELECGT